MFQAFSLLPDIGGEPIITGCNAVAIRSSRQLDIYLKRCGRARASLFVDHRHVYVFIRTLNFRGCSQPQSSFTVKLSRSMVCMLIVCLIFQ